MTALLDKVLAIFARQHTCTFTSELGSQSETRVLLVCRCGRSMVCPRVQQ
jgi:hypothetical protein